MSTSLLPPKSAYGNRALGRGQLTASVDPKGFSRRKHSRSPAGRKEPSVKVAAINDFLEFLLVERAASANTLMAYEHDLRQLAQYLRERLGQPGEIPWRAVDRTMVSRFIQNLKEQGYRANSVGRKLAVVRGLFAFLAEEGIISNNPASGLSSPRLTKPLRRPTPPEDVERLLERPDWNTTPEAKRDRAMLELLCAAGMRVSELVSLDLSSLQLGSAPYVRCSGRKSRSRTIPIRSRAADALRIYVERARPVLVLDKSETALFVSRRGRPLSRQGFWLNLKKYASAAGLSNEITARTLRYSYASRILREGVSLRDVQKMLGHANIATTRAYLSLLGPTSPGRDL